MSFSKKMKIISDGLLNKFDERVAEDKIVFVKPGSKVFDGALGEYVFSAGENIPLTGVAVSYEDSLIDGTAIQSGDIKLVVTADQEITQDGKILLDGVQHSIVGLKTAAYTGLLINYTIHVRK